MTDKPSVIHPEHSLAIDKNEVAGHILKLRGHKVMLDRDIAVYFGTTTSNLNEQ